MIFQKMRAQNYTEIAGEEYVEILDELLDKHQPFNATASRWIGWAWVSIVLHSGPQYLI